ncbi:acid-sensing ion channel 1B-like [Ostrea edulis]|uniref:acid-sensing ion channel 1B-like n=1 Tax=Ostrea edulis TaxID=37623 RepID=UPI0024AE932D|nr:acid-sensing ion channel 1B-like [Ostrea edulis]
MGISDMTLKQKSGVARDVGKYAWLIFTLLMTVTLVVFIVDAFINFLKYNTVTQISADNKNRIDFPAVTICNMNMVKKSIIHCNDTVFAGLDTIFLNFGETLVIEDILTPGLGFVKGEIPNGEQMLQCLLQYSNTVREMLPICTWKGRLEPCQNLFITTLTEMGVCFTFNGEGNQRLQTSHSGSDGGLGVFIDIQQANYFYSSTIQAGIKVVLHEPEEAPLPSMRGFLVAPGLSAEAVISRTGKNFLDEPYGRCLNIEEVGNPLHRYKSYSEKACRMECMIDYLVSADEHCRNCRHFLYPGPERLCEYKELEDCFVFYRNASTSGFTKGCKCKRPCVMYQYKTSISYARFMSDFMNTYFLTKGFFLSNEYSKDNFIELKIYYDSLIETAVTEVPEFNIFEMLSDIGGLMGIFLGASLLSLVELLEFFILLLRPRNKLKTAEAPAVEKDTTSLKESEGGTTHTPVKQKTGKGHRKLGNKKIYIAQKKI